MANSFPNYFTSNEWNVNDIVQASLNHPSDISYHSESEFSDALTESTVYLNPSNLLPNTRIGNRIGSRKLQRRENDSLKDHPFAQLHPKDIPPPGYSISMPSFHFIAKYMEPMYQQEILFKKKEFRINGVDKYSKKMLKGIEKSKRLVAEFEKEILGFLAKIEGRESEGRKGTGEKEEQLFSVNDCVELELNAILISLFKIERRKDDELVLKVNLTHSLDRFTLHCTCNYYNLYSKSMDDSYGNRTVEIYEPNKKEGWKKPKISFYDYLFK